jgi:nicotinic acid mononucleotide adenylyltransferase
VKPAHDPCSLNLSEVTFYPPPLPWKRKKQTEDFYRRRRNCEHGCGKECKLLRGRR